MRVLLVGSGGREHALAWGLARSPSIGELHAAPGNPGIGGLAQLHDVAVSDHEGLAELAVSLAADLVVVGPEAPLVGGFVDRLEDAGITAFGPGAAAAQLEGSKAFAKSVMDAAMVPTASFAVCDTVAAAQMAIADANGNVVIKADGLAAGKGVFVCSSVAEAEAAVQACLIDGRFGSAGARVLVEERLEGPEVSLLALCDGETVVPLAPARDHKRLGDGDAGPNTGGMGCYSPTPDVTAELVEDIVASVHRPVVNELARRDMPFRGCLYAGLMLTADGPKVLEFNVRFGDPEAQVLIPRLDGDLLDVLHRCAVGGLADASVGVSPRSCVTVVMAAPGYPDAPEEGIPIGGIDAADAVDDVIVFHAGTATRDGRLASAGGRVLNVTALGDDLAEARRRAYAAVELIDFPGEQHRTDIGAAAAVEQHA